MNGVAKRITHAGTTSWQRWSACEPCETRTFFLLRLARGDMQTGWFIMKVGLMQRGSMKCPTSASGAIPHKGKMDSYKGEHDLESANEGGLGSSRTEELGVCLRACVSYSRGRNDPGELGGSGWIVEVGRECDSVRSESLQNVEPEKRLGQVNGDASRHNPALRVCIAGVRCGSSGREPDHGRPCCFGRHESDDSLCETDEILTGGMC